MKSEVAPALSRIAIITSASSGIGWATALRMATDGYDVGFTYNGGRENADALAAQLEHWAGASLIVR